MAENFDSPTQTAPAVLQPLGVQNLLDDTAVGCCGGGSCHVPASDEK